MHLATHVVLKLSHTEPEAHCESLTQIVEQCPDAWQAFVPPHDVDVPEPAVHFEMQALLKPSQTESVEHCESLTQIAEQ